MLRWLLWSVIPFMAATPCRAVAVPPDSTMGHPSAATIGVSPLLVAAAADVWSVIARGDNPVWPGWNAADTPLLLYLPGRQELLVNHPDPPEGLREYQGPLSFPGARMMVRNGETLIGFDGQNTAMDVNGVRTLVVADPLSNLRQRVAGLIEDPRAAGVKTRALDFENLLQDPYDQLGLVVHEAFHVYQNRAAPDRGANEMLLLYYPVLSVENNISFGLEASALAAAIDAPGEDALREAALRWLAVRLDRRRKLPARAVQYEDGTEFNEGLAKYTEYRLFQTLEGRSPGAGLVGTQGFAGYRDLSRQRRNLVRQMVLNLRGEVSINNDPFGTAPLRFRLYYSGMAIGLLLDRISPSWKRDLFAADTSLTALARDALHAIPAELSAALTAARADTAATTLRAAKIRLAEEGRRHIAGKVAALESGLGTRLVVDYSRLGTPRLSIAFSPFGITAVDSVRTLFEQVPILVTFPDDSELRETLALPLMRDTHRMLVSCRLEKPMSRAELERRLGHAASRDLPPRPVKLQLPDVSLDLKRARVTWEPGAIRATLFPAVADSTR